jgi:hypothetical protein
MDRACGIRACVAVALEQLTSVAINMRAGVIKAF